MKISHVAVAASLVTAMAVSGSAFWQDASVPESREINSRPALGEAVADIGKSCWYVFQDKDDNYWFGTDGNGVCRYDGRILTRFTTRDGLVHDQIRGIQQHVPTGHILITTNGGVSMFDGERFVTLPIREVSSPGFGLMAGDLKSAGWVLNDTDTWLTGGAGPRRYDGTTLHQLTFPRSPFEKELNETLGHRDEWRPGDVWSVYKDSRGHVWFGTGEFGVCRFDGQSLDWLFERHLMQVPGGGWFGLRSIIEDRHGDFWFCNT